MVMRNEDRPDKGSAAQHRLQANYTIEDKKNVINFHRSGREKPYPYELESLRRQYGHRV